MPSRRSLLAATGVACSTGVLGGCLSALRGSRTGHLQLKGISLAWQSGGRSYTAKPLMILFDSDEGRVSGRYDPQYVGDAVRSPDDVVVTDELHESLSAWFEVEYVVGVCGEDFASEGESYGCLNTGTGRSDFNRVQVNDRATVRVRDDRFEVLDVEADANEVVTTEVRTMDFADAFGDDVTPDPGW